MATKRLGRWLAGVALSVTLGSAHGAIITTDPFAQFVDAGDSFTIEVSIAFEEATVGGAIDLFYDPTLVEFVSFEFDVAFLGPVADPAFSSVPDNCYLDGSPFGGCAVGDGELNALAFGNFDGIAGIHQVGVFVFTALGAGTADLRLAINDAPLEGFFSAETGAEMTVELRDAQVFISPAAIPVPGALWLMLGAMGAVGLAGRRRM